MASAPHSLTEPTAVAHQFDDLEQQRHADELGMWLFLATEIMFFGGLFLAYAVYRLQDEAAFAAVSHQHMDLLLGALNTAVLLCSSLTMALAVHAAQHSQRKALIGLLIATMVLGSVFLIVKGVEYSQKYHDGLIPLPKQGFHFDYVDPLPPGSSKGNAEMFIYLYFAMTGLHAIHMLIGLVLLATLTVLALRGGMLGDYSTPIHVSGLYWHFVDIVWVFLFPFFYLVGARGGP